MARRHEEMPARKAYPPPSRASARVRSRASSVSGEPEETKTTATNNEIDVEFILHRLLMANEFGRIRKLTRANLIALLKASVHQRRQESTNRDAALSAKNDELAAANELLQKERDAAREEATKRHLRDVFRREDLITAEIERKAEVLAQRMVAEGLRKQASALVSPELASVASPAPSMSHISATPTSKSEQTLGTAAASHSSPETETPRAKQSGSLLRRVLSGVASPFFRSNTPQSQERQQQEDRFNTSPARQEATLGKLPTVRKRPHEEPEPEFEVATPTKRNLPTSRALIAPATMPTKLSTISERTEPSEHMITMADATPSRPRPISKVRAARQGLTPTTRSWTSRPSALSSNPRQPNADIRHERLQLQKAAHEANVARAQDEVAKAPPRPTKRVKVDQLLYIPHNRPGECEGTFRVPDIDSDDEMEVDIDVPLRPNLFAESVSGNENSNTNSKPAEQNKVVKAGQLALDTAHTTSKRSQQIVRLNKDERQARRGRLNQELYDAKRFLKHSEAQHHEHYRNKVTLAERDLQRLEEQIKSQQQDAESDGEDLPAKPIYHFPRIGNFAPPIPKDPIEQKYKASKFRFGFLHWQRTGQLIEGLY